MMVAVTTETQEQRKLAYSVKEISQLTSLSIDFLRNEISAGRLQGKRFGARVLILTEDLQKYLQQKK